MGFYFILRPAGFLVRWGRPYSNLGKAHYFLALDKLETYI
jgi:hypothetical protein